MHIIIKKLETEEEIKGKAYVHWASWHEAYPGMVDAAYLDQLTLQKCEEMAYRWTDNIIIAKDGDRVIGFVGAGQNRNDSTHASGEVFALYVLSSYYGTGVGRMLMEAALDTLCPYHSVCLWVLKGNARAIRFYEKCGFHITGEENTLQMLNALEIRMIREA